MLMVRDSGKMRCAFFLASALVLGIACSDFAVLAQTDDDSLAASLESARRKRDPAQLESLKTQLQQRLSRHAHDAAGQYELSRVESYLADVAEKRKDKKAAVSAVDTAIESVQHSLQLNE